MTNHPGARIVVSSSIIEGNPTVKHHPILPFIACALLAALQSTVLAADSELEGRVGRLERILENQSGSDMLLQLQRLQMEMQELRGMLETQRFDIDKLQRQQRDQYLDIDSRLGSARSASQGGQSGGAPVNGHPQPTLPEGVIDASGTDLQVPTEGAAPIPSTTPPPVDSGPVGIPSLPLPETLGGSERDGYSNAFSLLKDRKYDEAKDAFNDLLRRYPQGEFTDNARYWLGETYYVQRNYPAALAEFDRLVQLNPNSPKASGAMLKIGYIQFDQKAYDQARVSLERVVKSYPNSTEARLAKSRLERIGESTP